MLEALQRILFACFLAGSLGMFDPGGCAAAKAGSTLLEQSKNVLRQDTAEDKMWVDEKTGSFVPLELEFLDEGGVKVRLSDIIDRPTILLPIYYYCPNICSKNLANLAVALSNLKAVPGRDFRVIALSFNDVEGPGDAARAKKNYMKIVGDGFPESEWKFLTGTMANIRSLTDSVGFTFKKIDDDTFIHPGALMVLGGDGKIIRYVYGTFLAGDIDMAIVDAEKGVVSLSVKRLLSFCFNYDPDKNKSVFQQVKVGVLVFFGVVLGFILIYFKKKKKV